MNIYFILKYPLYCATCHPYQWRRNNQNGWHSASEIRELYL